MNGNIRRESFYIDGEDKYDLDKSEEVIEKIQKIFGKPRFGQPEETLLFDGNYHLAVGLEKDLADHWRSLTPAAQLEVRRYYDVKEEASGVSVKLQRRIMPAIHRQ